MGSTTGHESETVNVAGLKASLQKFKDDRLGDFGNASEAIYYTQAEADEYNAALDGALGTTEPLTEEQATAYNEATPGAQKAAGDLLTDEEASAYNATLEGAVAEGDVKTPAVPMTARQYIDNKAVTSGFALTADDATGTDTFEAIGTATIEVDNNNGTDEFIF